jgi:hypothetical protein
MLERQSAIAGAIGLNYCKIEVPQLNPCWHLGLRLLFARLLRDGTIFI